MHKNPYELLPNSAFWRSGVAEQSPFEIQDLYKKKWTIETQFNIATAGSCFAQHIARNLRKNGYKVLDKEPPPPCLSIDEAKKHGFSIYSGRFGNIYTVAQCLQLAKEAFGEISFDDVSLAKGDCFVDKFRPNVEPLGFKTQQEVVESRREHLQKVKAMFLELDVFIFTLGLTEAWIDNEQDAVLPMVPGTLAGEFYPNRYTFKNYRHSEILSQFLELDKLLKKHRKKPDLKYILTVSPVPLTATASGRHVLQASTYSKSVLRAVCGELAATYEHIDYFPSYELITNVLTNSVYYEKNLRSVRPHGVEIVMKHFFKEHPPANCNASSPRQAITKEVDEEAVICEEEMLEANL